MSGCSSKKPFGTLLTRRLDSRSLTYSTAMSSLQLRISRRYSNVLTMAVWALCDSAAGAPTERSRTLG